MTAATEPDEAALVEDLASAGFVSGVDHGYWRLVARKGIVVTVEVAANTGRRVSMRLDCSGYPGIAPTGQLWSLVDNSPLPVSEWPQGGRATEVFNTTWSSQNDGAFYFPYDRRAIVGHEPWTAAHPGYVWSIDKTLVDVLHLIRGVLRTATSPAEDSDGQLEEAS